MTTLISPVLFSKRFGVSPDAIAAAGLFDPILNCDSKLFVDPLLLESSDVATMRSNGHALLREHFGNVIKLVAVSRAHNDAAWKGAAKLLNLKERRETCLGYGGSGTSGSSRPKTIREQILRTAKEIIELGENNPELISLMGMFEEGVGSDTISDLTTNAIMPVLAQITAEFCKSQGVATRRFDEFDGLELPENPYVEDMPVILVPRDVLRDLPLSADMADVSRVVFANEKLRNRVNAYVANITKASVIEKKEALRKASLESLENFKSVLRAVLSSSDAYDPNADPLGLYRLRQIMGSDLSAFKQDGLKIGAPSGPELLKAVQEIIKHFRHAIERNNLWELLWDANKPRREKAAQLIFFGIADMFCKANNIDIAPETNPGGGPVDFRFSVGYHNRIIVEIKLSKGRVVHGYEHQTDIYAEASRTDLAVFLLVDVGGMGKKLQTIQTRRNELVAANRLAPIIELVDGRRRESASKRAGIGAVIEDDVEEDDEDDEA